MNQDGIWLTILEYANAKNTSISTIRRAIKAGHVKYKEENGKYLIWTKHDSAKAELSMKMEIEMLKRNNRELMEELSDLKMLLQVYENRGGPREVELPSIPEFEL